MFASPVPDGHRIEPLGRLHAFIDESGQRTRSTASSDHFVMSAVIITEENLSDAATLLELLRTDLKRNTGDPLRWTNIKNHAQRLHAAKTLGSVDWLQVSSVVVCKRHLADDGLDEAESYLYTLRYL